MKKRQLYFLLLLSLFLIFNVVGCDTQDTDTNGNDQDVVIERVDLKGTVAINRQGEGEQSGIRVTVEGAGITATTDSEGRFSLNLTTGRSYTLVATREDLATTKIIDLYLDSKDPIKEIKMIIQKPVSLEYLDSTPPTIGVKGLKNMATLNPYETIIIESNKTIYEYYVSLNDHFYQEAYGRPQTKEVKLPSVSFPLNYGGGSQQLVVAVVDANNNVTKKIFQVYMPGKGEGTTPNPPNYVEVLSYTRNNSIPLLEMPHITESQLKGMPEGTMHYLFLDWASSPSATAYNVYRSFDGLEYTQVDTVSSNSFFDADPALGVGVEVWYKVTAVNRNGESSFSPAVYVIPLPVYEISLVGPNEKDTPLNPDLIWESNDLEVEDLLYRYVVNLRDTSIHHDSWDGWWNFEFNSYNPVNSINPGFLLDRGKRYQWSVNTARADKIYLDGPNGYSQAITFGALAHFNIRPENSAMFFETIK